MWGCEVDQDGGGGVVAVGRCRDWTQKCTRKMKTCVLCVMRN